MPHPSSRASRVGRAALLACTATITTLAVAAPPAAAKTPKPVVRISPGEVTVYKVGDAPETIPDDVRAAVMGTVTSYVNAATVTPLRKGKLADDAVLAPMLAPPVAARLAGPDRATLVDEGLPKATAKVVVSSAPVALTGLADRNGNIVVVTAAVDATTKTKTAKGKLSIRRAGELVFEPDNGTWKISGYSFIVDRTGKSVPGATTTTTVPAAAAAPTPATAAR